MRERNKQCRAVAGQLGCSTADREFAEAFEQASRKQACIFEAESRQEVLQDWYLAQLTRECMKALAFSKLTADLCRTLRGMEKEHPAKSQSALTDTHIVAEPVL